MEKKSIKSIFNQVTQDSMQIVAHELFEMLESHGIENKIMNTHIIGLFCLKRAIFHADKSIIHMSGWLEAGYRYAKEAGVDIDKLNFAVSLLKKP
jgi:hypothetical protein